MLRKVAILFVIAGLASPLAACSQKSGTSASTTAESSTGAAPAGAGITVAGSTALLPLVKQAAVDYQAKNPNAKISVSGGGSRVGITQAAQKGVDIGNSDIPAPDEPSLVDHEVAVVPFAVVVNPASGVKNLTKAQIVQIFSGKVTNFKSVGGADQAITIINRPRSSGTRAVFVKTFMNGQQPTEGGSTQDSSGTVAAMVGQTPAAISYVAKSYVKPPLVAASVDGVAATDDNVKSGKYPFWSYEHMFTNGQPSKDVADFIDFVKNDKTALTALGFIPISEMKK
jgi:phosphate transport system substrate-binding protein